MRGVILAAVFAVIVAGAYASDSSGPAEKLLSDAVDLYRKGDLPASLLGMTDVLERDPENAAAKTYVWTIARRMREREKKAFLTEAEKDEAVRRAYDLLAARRRQSQQTVDELERVYKRTRNVRGPEDLAASADGLDKFLGAEFQDERVKAQAEAYFQRIKANLTRALKGKAFVSKKDHLNAEATLCYYQGDWPGAVAKWEGALQEDPADAGIKRNAERVRELIRRRESQGRIRDLSAQAETYQRTGFMTEAAAAWREILGLDPANDAARQNLPLCLKAAEKEERTRKLKELTAKGVGLYQAGRPSEAVDVWLKALQLDPGYDQARVWISLVGKRLEGAKASSASAPNPAAKARPSSGQNEGPSDEDLRRAQDLYRQGLLLYAGNEVSKAIVQWKEALRLAPGLVQAQQALRQAEAESKYLE